MELRCAAHPKDVKTYDTQRLREDFLVQGLFKPGETKLVYSHVDRIIFGSVCPIQPITLEAGQELRAAYFLERRELGVINIGPKGSVTVDGTEYVLNTPDEGVGLGCGSGVNRPTGRDDRFFITHHDMAGLGGFAHIVEYDGVFR